MMIKFFGIAREITGCHTVQIGNSESIANVSEVKRWLSRQYPGMQQLQSFAIAVDAAYADDATSVDGNSEIAVLPPVSGG